MTMTNAGGFTFKIFQPCQQVISRFLFTDVYIDALILKCHNPQKQFYQDSLTY